MKTTMTLALVLSLVAVACDKKDGGAATGAGSASSKTAPKVELAEVTNADLGYTIKLPKDAKTTSSDKNGGMYSAGLVTVIVGPTLDVNSADDLLPNSSNKDGAAIEKKAEGDTLLAVVTKSGAPIDVLSGIKGKKIYAKCMTPPDDKELALAICASLKATK